MRITRSLLMLIFLALFAVTDLSAQAKTQPSPTPPVLGLSLFPADGTKNSEAAKFRNAGIASMVKGNRLEAIGNFSSAIQLDPEYSDAYRRRGAAQSDLGNHDQAITDFTRAIGLTPKETILYLCRGSEYLLFKKDYDAAIADFSKGIEIDPKEMFLYSFRARAYDKLGRPELAAADRKAFLELRSKISQK